MAIPGSSEASPQPPTKPSLPLSSSSSSSSSTPSPLLEVETAKCDSCGFTEDCTPTYILRIRERFHGRWICGLCIEAVKDEILRSNRLITTEEALNRHISVCEEFRSMKPGSQKTSSEHPILAMGRLLRRSLDSPRAPRSNEEAESAATPKALIDQISAYQLPPHPPRLRLILRLLPVPGGPPPPPQIRRCILRSCSELDRAVVCLASHPQAPPPPPAQPGQARVDRPIRSQLGDRLPPDACDHVVQRRRVSVDRGGAHRWLLAVPVRRRGGLGRGEPLRLRLRSDPLDWILILIYILCLVEPLGQCLVRMCHGVTVFSVFLLSTGEYCHSLTRTQFELILSRVVPDRAEEQQKEQKKKKLKPAGGEKLVGGMDGRSGCSSKVPSLPPPRPRSPPEYPDLYGKRREAARVQMLEREIRFLEEELKSVSSLQPASRACKEVADFVAANSDPLIHTTQKKRKSRRFWKWLSRSGFSFLASIAVPVARATALPAALAATVVPVARAAAVHVARASSVPVARATCASAVPVARATCASAVPVARVTCASAVPVARAGPVFNVRFLSHGAAAPAPALVPAAVPARVPAAVPARVPAAVPALVSAAVKK
ncbi:hypothetical protein SAY86_030400 [Trapa natans]|uniref:G protein gamma domain-containing protein n=1 Tax=Trapa natans TaxID=22666 RepID=A0AAN7M551_TRANT|nr:hypothetical protein SAY86_030400 [Trapa natans]